MVLRKTLDLSTISRDYRPIEIESSLRVPSSLPGRFVLSPMTRASNPRKHLVLATTSVLKDLTNCEAELIETVAKRDRVSAGATPSHRFTSANYLKQALV